MTLSLPSQPERDPGTDDGEYEYPFNEVGFPQECSNDISDLQWYAGFTSIGNLLIVST
jgi:hypothetical protein